MNKMKAMYSVTIRYSLQDTMKSQLIQPCQKHTKPKVMLNLKFSWLY